MPGLNTNHDMALLRLADKLVRNGDLQGALSSILKARDVDPTNRYAEAYEERVRGLLRQQAGPEAEEPVMPPAAQQVVVDAAAALNRRLEEIQSILNDVNGAIIRNDFPEALEFIGRARELDPANEDFAVLEEQVRAAVEGASSIAEDPPVYYEVVKSTLDAYVAEAVDLAARADFEEALHLVTKGFVLDPTHEGLRDAERYINAARQIQEAQKKSTLLAEKLYRRLIEREIEEREELAGHIKTARTLLRNGAFDEALTEIALGYTIDTRSTELREIEQTIWQTRATTQAESDTPSKREEVARLIRLHILAAEEFAKNGDFVKALDGLAKAYVIDPANTEIKRTEVRIRQAELRHHQASGSPLKLVYYHDRVVNGE